MYLGDPTKFTEVEREQLLTKLFEILKNDDQMVYEIAWDIPARILPYFESSFDFHNGPLGGAPCVNVLVDIFNVLSANSNPKAMFLTCSECVKHLERQELAPTDTRNRDVADRFFEIKFVTVYEIMFATLQRVGAQFPSRFLTTAISALLTALTNNIDRVSMRSCYFLLRRFFLFARDYNPVPPKDKQVSETELSLQRKLLQRFLTDAVSIALHKHSVVWTYRFFVELKQGLAFNPKQSIRSVGYQLHEYVQFFAEIIDRLTQLALSLDIDIEDSFATLVADSVKEYDTSLVEKSDAESESSTIIPGRPVFDFASAKTAESIFLSNEGILLLATSLRFDDRTNVNTFAPTFPELIKLTKRFVAGSEEDPSGTPSVGVQDALCFWALWLLRKLTPEQVQAVGKSLFFSYLHMLMLISTTTPEPNVQKMVYSIATKFLLLHTKETREEYLMDTVEYCQYHSVRERAVLLLRDFMIAKRPAPKQPTQEKSEKDGVDAVTDSVKNLNIAQPAPLVELSPAHHATLQGLILDQTKAIHLSDQGLLSEDFTLLVAWLGFINAVEMDQRFVDQVKAEVRKLAALERGVDGKEDANAESVRARQQLLKTALQNL